MQKAHKYLSENVSWYKKWHNTNYASALHLFVLVVVLVFLGNSVVKQFIQVPGDSLTAAALRDLKGNPERSGVAVGQAGDRILVKFKNTTGFDKRAAILADRKLKVKSKIPGINVEVLSVDPTDTPKDVVQRIKEKYSQDIEFVEVDILTEPSAIPNDPQFSAQWAKTLAGFPAAWDMTVGTNNVTVGISDTGVDCTHPDLVQNCVAGWNFYDNNADTSDVYSSGHGTAVAGTVASIGNNGRDIAGGAWNVKIMPLRISDLNGGGFSSVIANSVVYAADRGVQIVNNSYLSIDTSYTLQAAADYLASKGGVFVSSAGNTGASTGAAINNPSYVIASASDPNDNIYGWSSYGNNVDVSAPGCATTTAKGGGTRGFCGTSNSAPEVSGLLALMYSVNPNLTNQTARDALYSTALDLGAPGWDPYFGWGRIRADLAVRAVLGGNIPPPQPPTPPGVDTIAPSVPQNFIAHNISNTTANPTWSASTDNVGVIGYNLFRNGVKIWTGTSTNFVDNSLSSGTTYLYAVSAFDAAGNTSTQSASISVTTLGTSTPAPVNDTTAPSVPTNLQSSSVTTSQVNIIWNPSADNVGVTGYNLYRNAVKIWNGNSTSYTNTGLNPSTAYTYTVSAYDAAGNTSAQSSALLVTTSAIVPTPTPGDTTAPSIPRGLETHNVTTSSVLIIWNTASDNVGVTGYNLFRNGVKIWNGDALGVNNTNLLPGTSYTYTVSAYDAAGNTSAQSAAWSVTTLGTPPPVADISAPSTPTNLRTASVSSSQISLAWNAAYDNAGVTGYNLFRNGVKIWTGTALNLNDSNLSDNTTYLYSVSAFDAAGNVSAVSASLSVTTPAIQSPSDTIAPTIPQNLQTHNLRSTNLLLIWNPSADNVGVTGYNLYRNAVKIWNGNSTSYTNTGLNPSTSYTYTVSAYDAAGNTSAQSSATNATTLAY